jgi:hypothetical protein
MTAQQASDKPQIRQEIVWMMTSPNNLRQPWKVSARIVRAKWRQCVVIVYGEENEWS